MPIYLPSKLNPIKKNSKFDSRVDINDKSCKLLPISKKFTILQQNKIENKPDIETKHIRLGLKRLSLKKVNN